MAIIPKYQLKELFECGDLISQSSMTDLIDSTYNPTLIAGGNVNITCVNTPSGPQITISSTGGGGGGGSSIIVPGAGTGSTVRCGVGNVASGPGSAALSGCDNHA